MHGPHAFFSLSDSPNILFLKFEDMKKDRRDTVTKVAKFMGCALGPGALDSIVGLTGFDKMKKADSKTGKHRRPGALPHLRKGIVGDWRNYFSTEQSARMDAEYRKRLDGTGLNFQFD